MEKLLKSDKRQRMELLLRIGCLLMESGADTSRIIRNVRRMAEHMGFKDNQVSVFVDFHKVGVEIDDNHDPLVMFRRCERRGVNMAMLSDISHLTFKAVSEEYTIEQYKEELESIAHRKRSYSPWLTALAGGFACGGFCFLFGSDWMAFFYAAFAAMLGLRLRMWLDSHRMNPFITTCVVAFFSTLVAWLLGTMSVFAGVSTVLPTWLQSVTPWHPLMACALFLIPGVPLINFVNDMLSGYVLMGAGRATVTLLVVLSMAFGIGLAIKVFGIDNFVRDLSMVPHHSYWEYSLVAAISAVGFSMIFNTPPRLLWVVALGGCVAVCTRNFVSLGADSGNIGLGMGTLLGTLTGSVLVSLLFTRVVRWLNTPHHCLSIPSVIPMVPGVLMYRALFAFIDMNGVVGEVTVAMHNAITAMLIILFIAVGVAVPNIFFPKMMEKFPNLSQKMGAGNLKGVFRGKRS